MFTIGRFARLTGVSAKRLRHYDGIGLFHPVWVDPRTGYRFYSASQIPDLRRIAALIDMGIPLSRIVEVRRGGESLAALLRQRRSELEAERAAVDVRLRELDIRLEQAGDLDVVLRTRPPGRWASLRAEVEPDADLAPLFVEVEEHVRSSDARSSQPPVCIVHVSSGPQRTLELLIPIDRRIAASGRVMPVTTPAARVASSLVVGGYEELATTVDGLRDWVSDTGRRISGPPWYVYLRFSAEEYLRLPEEYLTDKRSELVTEVLMEVEG